MSIIMKGSEVAAGMKEKLLTEHEEIKKHGINPKLAIVRVEQRSDDLAYERGALKRFAGLGIEAQVGESDGFAPCTPSAVMEMLAHYDVELKGKNIVVGRSMVVGRPLAMLMLASHATVTICHTRTIDMPLICRRADIIVAAAGKANMITSEYVNEKSIIADVGINVNSEGKLCGDVDFASVSEKAAMISPVPGGVGAVTTSVLAKNVLRASRLLNGI